MSVQVLSWITLLAGYVLVLLGIWRWGRVAVSAHENCAFGILVWLCPILCLVLLAVVIGPVTATRYRFVMIPFFAILAAHALPCRASAIRSRSNYQHFSSMGSDHMDAHPLDAHHTIL